MSYVVHKVLLPLARGEHRIAVEVGHHEFLHTQVQRGSVAVWYECNPENPKSPRVYHLVHTGDETPDGCVHLATIMVVEDYILHLYGSES